MSGGRATTPETLRPWPIITRMAVRKASSMSAPGAFDVPTVLKPLAALSCQ